MKKGLILTGGRLNVAFARSFLCEHTFDKVIAVDGGLKAARELDIIPDYIVGDFDTAEPELIQQYKEIPYIVWDMHQPEKNETDTELARSRALAIGCTELVFLGATGGRIDHMLGNIDALYACMQTGVSACLVDGQNKLYLLDQGKTFYRDNLWGPFISFLPYTGEVSGITLHGFKYPLDGRHIKRGEEVGLCISNELSGESGSLDFDSGILICVEAHD
ncbi:MAG: thiamine diphosphokinase [Lachnospiraceae bacterium]